MTEPAAIPRFTAAADGTLDARMLAAWRRDGVLVLERFLAPETCDRLMARADAIVEAFDPSDAVVFSTLTHAHDRSRYFLDSGDAIRCFLEEDAVGPDGRLTRARTRAVNKIGHALHDLDPDFAPVSRDPRLARLCAGLGLARPLLLQSMLIFKQPEIGGEVTCHQDATFLRTEPESVTGLWFALEDATPENGCLEVLPGHHLGPLKQCYRRHGDALSMETLDDTPWPEDARVALPVPRGTLVVLHGRLPHLSRANRSPRSRQAYALHVIDGACAYADDNWLRRRQGMPLRGFETETRP